MNSVRSSLGALTCDLKSSAYSAYDLNQSATSIYNDFDTEFDNVNDHIKTD